MGHRAKRHVFGSFGNTNELACGSLLLAHLRRGPAVQKSWRVLRTRQVCDRERIDATRGDVSYISLHAPREPVGRR